MKQEVSSNILSIGPALEREQLLTVSVPECRNCFARSNGALGGVAGWRYRIGEEDIGKKR
jgi:hypothetical protein